MNYDGLPLDYLFALQRDYAVRIKDVGDAIYRELRREWREKNPPGPSGPTHMKEEPGGQRGG